MQKNILFIYFYYFSHTKGFNSILLKTITMNREKKVEEYCLKTVREDIL